MTRPSPNFEKIRKIAEYLDSVRVPKRPFEIAKAIGMFKSYEVGTLWTLERNGLVVRETLPERAKSGRKIFAYRILDGWREQFKKLEDRWSEKNAEK